MDKSVIVHMNDDSTMIFISPKQGKNYSYDSQTFYLNASTVEFAIPYTSIKYIEFKCIDMDKMIKYKDSGIPIYYLRKEDEKL